MKAYRGFVPPCGIFCGGCPSYHKERSPCPGAEIRCRERQCKGIYVCCIEKRGHRFCFECDIFPCNRFKRFAETWRKYGQDLIDNQAQLKRLDGDAGRWLNAWNDFEKE
jgi:hypothetical protein